MLDFNIMPIHEITLPIQSELPTVESTRAMVACIANNGVVCASNHTPEYVQWLQYLTHHKAIIMCDKTYATLQQPLQNRYNIVVSDTCHGIEGFNLCCFDNIDSALNEATFYQAETEQSPIMFIGGLPIYNYALNICDTIYLTRYNKDIDGDKLVENYDWPCIWQSSCTTNPDIEFKILQKVSQ